MNYAELKQLAKLNKVRVTDLIAMAPQNDPFYAGTKAGLAKATWFAELWERFGFTTGVHLRRIHYRIVSQGDIQDANGKPYENTLTCWGELNNAAKAARYLGLVSVDSFIDARNPPPKVFRDPDYLPESPWLYLPEDEWHLPSINTDLGFAMDMLEPELLGFGYEAEDQPYLLEIWCEKSTMNDVLVPICENYHANFVTGLGFLSITAVQNLLDRAQESGKPTRVFYIADFDPAGSFMPQQIARQIEFWLQQKNMDLDIALMPLALTKEQVIQYELPRIPIKDTDRRATNFEDRFGEGAVELDALEALHPGSLTELVTSAMDEFIDHSLQRRLRESRASIKSWVADQWQYLTEEERHQFEEVSSVISTIASRYQDRLTAMASELEAEVSPFRDEMENLRQAITKKAVWLEAELPGRPAPEVMPNDDDWLFRSDRDYMTQLDQYKKAGSSQGEDSPDPFI